MKKSSGKKHQVNEMALHLDMGIVKDCKNLEDSYGLICVKCNKCKRFDKKECKACKFCKTNGKCKFNYYEKNPCKRFKRKSE